MLKLGFSRCNVDQAMFFKRDRQKLTIVLVHVDDCMTVATSIILIDHFKAEITKHVEIRHDHEKRTIHLSQCSYIDSILRHYNLQDLKPISTPMETHIKLLTSQSPATTAEFTQMCDVPHHKAVGSLMYASLGTHPNISFAIQTLSHFSTNPGVTHWEAIN
jgi:hypothetical protein